MTPEELLVDIKRHIYNSKEFNPMIQKWDVDIFVRRYGITPFLMYKMLKDDPILNTTKQEDKIQFKRRKLKSLH